VLPASASFRDFGLHTGTALPETAADDGDLLMIDWDSDGRAELVFVRRRNTASSMIEVDVLTASSQYSQYALRTKTAFHQWEDQNGTFALERFDRDARPDLVLLKHLTAGMTQLEVHVLAAMP